MLKKKLRYVISKSVEKFEGELKGLKKNPILYRDQGNKHMHANYQYLSKRFNFTFS